MVDKTIWIDTNEAMELASQNGAPISRQTVINWVSEYDLGRKIGGRWRVDKNRLMNFLQGEKHA